MDDVLKEMARQVPSALAVMFTVYYFLRFIEKMDERREANAKAKAEEQRLHDVKINEMWTKNISLMNSKSDETFKLIADMVQDHETASADRYRKMNITQDLFKAVERQIESKKE